jgi:hypothetical protein
MNKALNRSIYYFNTKLSWKKNFSDINKRDIQTEKQNFTYSRKRNSSPRKEEVNPAQYILEGGKISPEKREKYTRRERNIRESQQKDSSESISSALNRVLNRLEALEGKWETSQRPRESRDPNRF